jgi:hypothetical protein
MSSQAEALALEGQRMQRETCGRQRAAATGLPQVENMRRTTCKPTSSGADTAEYRAEMLATCRSCLEASRDQRRSRT